MSPATRRESGPVRECRRLPHQAVRKRAWPAGSDSPPSPASPFSDISVLFMFLDMDAHSSERTMRLRSVRNAAPGWLWIACCGACGHTAGLPVH